MGYTNYWECKTDFTDNEWEAVCNEARYIEDNEYSYQENLTGVLDVVDIDKEKFKNKISFNGIGNNGHETFILEKKATDFSFCKTAQKPYDIYVWHLLTFCQMIKKDFYAKRDKWYWDKSRPLSDVYKPQKQVDRSGAVK
jgi:hypothetical protein